MNETLYGPMPERTSEEFRLRLWLEDAICFSYHRARTSEGQAMKILGVDRLSFRDIYQAWIIMGGSVPDDMEEDVANTD